MAIEKSSEGGGSDGRGGGGGGDVWPEGPRLQQALAAAEGRLRFVKEVSSGDIQLYKHTKASLLEELAKRGYSEPLPPLLDTPASLFTSDGLEQLEQAAASAATALSSSRSAAAAAARERVKSRAAALESRRGKVAEAIAALDKGREEVIQAASQSKEEVGLKMQSVLDAITQREAELMTVVQRVAHTKRTQFEEHHEEIVQVKSTLEAVIGKIKGALNLENPYDLLEAAASLHEAVDEQLALGAAGAKLKTQASLELELDASRQLHVISNIGFGNSSGGGARGRDLEISDDHVRQAMASHRRAIDQKRLEEVRGGNLDASDRRGTPSERPVDRRMEEVKAGGTQNNGTSGLDRTQIHVMSPGVEGKERASIITVSTRQGGEMGMGMGSAVGIHRARRAGEDEHAHSPAVDSTAARRMQAGRGESPSMSRDSAGGRNLAAYVQTGASGSVLKLSSQRLSANDLESLPALLASHSSITTVDLTDSGVGDGGAALVGSACAASDRVAVLGLSGNKLGDAGVRALSATLPKNATLRSLFLRNNEIGPAGAKSLALVLLSSSNITKINLKNNLLGADGARELIPLLSSTRSLLEINLWNNGIGAEGATAIAEALGRDGGATLEDLDVGCNAIGCRGAAALAQSLRANRRIERLNLRWNEIEDEGGNALASAVRDNNSLRELQMFGNKLSEEAGAALADACAACQGLKLLQ